MGDWTKRGHEVGCGLNASRADFRNSVRLHCPLDILIGQASEIRTRRLRCFTRSLISVAAKFRTLEPKYRAAEKKASQKTLRPPPALPEAHRFDSRAASRRRFLRQASTTRERAKQEDGGRDGIRTPGMESSLDSCSFNVLGGTDLCRPENVRPVRSITNATAAHIKCGGLLGQVSSLRQTRHAPRISVFPLPKRRFAAINCRAAKGSFRCGRMRLLA
jgi:hypothetical protein